MYGWETTGIVRQIRLVLMDGPRAWALAGLENIKEFESIDALERFPCTNIYELLKDSCSQYNDGTALTFLPDGKTDDIVTRITYRQLSARLTQTANLLHALGVGHDDAVSILMPNLPETHFALWGGAAAGIASPINPFLEPVQITEIINATGAKTLISMAPDSDPCYWQKVCEVVRHTPKLKAIVVVNLPGTTTTAPPEAPRSGLQIVDYQQEVVQQDDKQLISGREFSPEDIALYMHTGGTTGCPKIAQLSQANLAHMAQLYKEMNDKRGRFTAFSGLPLFHVFGMNATGLAAFIGGRHMVMMTPLGYRNPEVIRNFWHHVDRFKPQTFATVPTILSALMDVPVGDCDISSLKEVTVGAAPLSDQLKKNFAERFSIQVLNGYGMTESSLVLTRASPDYPPPLGSVGLRIPYLDLIAAELQGTRIIRQCKTNETGSILFRGPNLFAGYLNPDDGKSAWIEDGWFNTGDLGYLDENGYLFLTGRISDLIIRGGHNISPALIEAPLSTHPAVSQVVAIGQPDPYVGEIPVAYVTLKAGCNSTPDDLLEYCRETISERAAIPKRIEVIESIPLTAVAKIFKPALRERATEFALAATLEEANIEANVRACTDKHRGLVATVTVNRKKQGIEAAKLLQNYSLIIKYS